MWPALGVESWSSEPHVRARTGQAVSARLESTDLAVPLRDNARTRRRRTDVSHDASVLDRSLSPHGGQRAETEAPASAGPDRDSNHRRHTSRGTLVLPLRPGRPPHRRLRGGAHPSGRRRRAGTQITGRSARCPRRTLPAEQCVARRDLLSKDAVGPRSLRLCAGPISTGQLTRRSSTRSSTCSHGGAGRRGHRRRRS